MTGKDGPFPKFGTMSTIDLTQETGTLPTRNWQENTYALEGKINAEAFMQYQVRPRSCFACPIGCSRDTKTRKWGREYVTEGPDYETMYAFGPNCEISDPEVIIAADMLCDDYGMDTISCGVTIGYWMTEGIPGMWKPFAIADLAFAVLFAAAYAALPAGGRR